MYTWHVHKIEKFRYPINDIILKRRKELVKTVLVTLSGKVLFYNRYKINGTFNHKTFNAGHVRLTSSKHTRSLAAEGEFLWNSGTKWQIFTGPIFQGSKDIGSGTFYSRVASSKEIRHNMSHHLVRVNLRSLRLLFLAFYDRIRKEKQQLIPVWLQL